MNSATVLFRRPGRSRTPVRAFDLRQAVHRKKNPAGPVSLLSAVKGRLHYRKVVYVCCELVQQTDEAQIDIHERDFGYIEPPSTQHQLCPLCSVMFTD